MSSRVVKVLHQFNVQTHSYVKLIPEYLSGRKFSIYYLNPVSSYSTSNPQLLNKKDFINDNSKIQTNEEKNEKKPRYILLQEQGFLPIYKMHYARLFAAVNKVKWQQLYLLSGSVPLTFVCASVGILPAVVPLATICVGGVITSTIWIFSAIFSRVVGAVLISPDGKTICISYVDSKGQRQDDLFPTGELIPLSDMPYQKYTASWWVLLQRYPTPECEFQTYKMLVQNYDITDKKRFFEVFRSSI